MKARLLVVAILLPVSHVTLAFAQGGGGGAAPGGSGGGAQQPSVQYFPGGVAPTPAGKPLGGGNVDNSSSMPKMGGETDSFDLTKGRGSSGTVYGSESGAADFGGGDSVRLGEGGGGSVDQHLVRKGDTLWGICDYYFRNPYQWPRIWSYNPQIQNPHWIYPGDLVRLRGGLGTLGTALGGAPPTSMVDRRRQVVPETIFLRDVGFIDDSDRENWGEVSGAGVDKMFLTDTDAVYMHIAEGHDPKVGQELTVFRPVKNVAGGRLVQLQGSIRIDRWDPKARTARGQVVETLDVIERGARVGPVPRKFNVVPPVRNDLELKASIIASLYPHNFYGQNQIVFIDKGTEDGVRSGNRLFVARRGDDWRRTLKSDVAGRRIDQSSERPADESRVPKFPYSEMPEEIIGEIRIVESKAHTSAALVTRSVREIEREDTAVMRKGY